MKHNKLLPLLSAAALLTGACGVQATDTKKVEAKQQSKPLLSDKEMNQTSDSDSASKNVVGDVEQPKASPEASTGYSYFEGDCY